MGYDFVTDMLVLQITLDKSNISASAVKGMWESMAGQSLAEALRLVVSRELDIEFSELVKGYVREDSDNTYIDVFLYDSLSSGAGYSISVSLIRACMSDQTLHNRTASKKFFE